MLNHNNFTQIMAGLCDLYNKKPSEFMLDVYYEIFKDYDDKVFNDAIMNCVKSNKYNVLPKPAEILEFLEGNKDDKALIAWMEATNTAQKCGYYETPEFKDHIISHCIKELGGWMEFCSFDKEQLPFIEKRFMNFYRLFLKRGINKPVNLIGYVDLKNNQKGYSLASGQELPLNKPEIGQISTKRGQSMPNTLKR